MDAGGSLKLQGDLNLSQTSLFPPASQPPGSMFGLGSQDGLPSLGALAAQIPGGSEPQNALAEHFAGDLQSQGLQLPSQSLGGASLLSVPPLQQADPMNLFTAMAHNLAVMSTGARLHRTPPKTMLAPCYGPCVLRPLCSALPHIDADPYALLVGRALQPNLRRHPLALACLAQHLT